MNNSEGYDSSYLRKVAKKREQEDLFAPRSSNGFLKLGVPLLILVLLGVIAYLLMRDRNLISNDNTIEQNQEYVASTNEPKRDKASIVASSQDKNKNNGTMSNYNASEPATITMDDTRQKKDIENNVDNFKASEAQDTDKANIENPDNVVAADDSTDNKVATDPILAATKESISKSMTTTNKMSDEDIAKIAQLVVLQMKQSQKTEPVNNDLEQSLKKAELETQEYEKGTKSAPKGTKISHYNKVSMKDKSNKTNQKIKSLYSKNKNKKSSKFKKSTDFMLKNRTNEMRYYVVKDGDTLSTIAIKAYGNAKYYTKIYEANPYILRNANLIYVGQKIRVPK